MLYPGSGIPRRMFLDYVSLKLKALGSFETSEGLLITMIFRNVGGTINTA